MTVMCVNASAIAPQPWRNGGGATRELLTWPDGSDWRLRISRADIAADGPFSVFAGVQRWFTVLEGAGVTLEFPDQTRVQTRYDTPICFDGAPAPLCRLIDGATQDLNLMLRQGRGCMVEAKDGQPWAADFDVRSLYCAVSGLWRCQRQTQALPAHSLLWQIAAEGEAWTFTPDAPTTSPCAWWMGYSPL
jgi:environmental stress-induced protein Ves